MRQQVRLLILLLLFFAFTGCTGKKESGKGKYVNVALSSCVRSLDPRVGNENPSSFVIRLLYEGLMRMGEGGRIHPGMAESYEVSEDQMRYTFHLRAATWSNGDPVTAYDFEYAWKKAVNPAFCQNGRFYLLYDQECQSLLAGRS